VRLSVPNTAVGAGSHTLVRNANDSVEHLLNGCRVAGLRASATVYPMATTGWGPVYDNISDTFSFALAPKEEE